MSQRIVLGALIILFLIAEPDGLVALWAAAPTRTFAGRPPGLDLAAHRLPSERNQSSMSSLIPSRIARANDAALSACRLRSALGACRRRAAARADEQYFPLQSYRVGPYAAGGTGFFGGFIDYLNLINIRDGGVNGVKLTWDECETQYEVERGVECYERQKSHADVRRLEPALGRHRLRDDRPHHRRQGAADHRQPRPHRFHRRPRVPLRLPAAAQPLQRDLRHHQLHRLPSEAASTSSKGKKIVVLYHGSPYGKETIPIYELLAQKYGFDRQQIEVPHPGNEQQSQWLTIRRAKPDYVVLRGWGVMNPVALKTAQKVGFPADHIIGNVWSNSEEDVHPGRRRRQGLHRHHHPGLRHATIRCCRRSIKTVYGAGKGNLEDKKRIGSVYHNLGIVNGILNVEAIRIAQEKFGHRTLTGDEVRWGFEHLKLDDARVEALGAKDLFHSINVTWDNHEGDGHVTLPAMGRQEVERGLRLDRAGLGAAAADHREVGGGLCQGEGHQAARLQQGALSMSAPAILEVDAIALTYSGIIPALREVTLTVPHGAIVALLGANGAGKTTTLKAISRWPGRPRGADYGRIAYRGDDVTHADPARLVERGLVQVLEGRRCFAHLSVEENLRIGAYSQRPSRREVDAGLERVYAIFPRLKTHRRSLAGVTSGGEQQMIAIGRALMARPRLLLLDEPSMGLAPQIVEEIFEILARLNRDDGVSILLAEQNATVALHYASYGYVLETGRVVAEGSSAELRREDALQNAYLGAVL